MSFKYQKRVKLGKNLGLNVSKAGVSPSIRTRYGSISPKGFSIRTGIPGLSYRGKNQNAFGIMLLVGAIYVGFLFMRWSFREIYHFILRRKMDIQMRKAKKAAVNNNVHNSGSSP